MVTLKGRLHGQAVSIYENILRLFGKGEKEEEEDGYQDFQVKSISPSLVVIPEMDDITETDVRYPLIQPFADAHIYWDEEGEELVYEVEEPHLNEKEERMLERVKDAMETKISVPMSGLETTDDVVDYLVETADEVVRELGYDLDESERNKLMYYIYRNFAGLEEVEPLMHDPYIEDIGCSGTDIPVYIIHSKFGSIRTDLDFHDEDRLGNLIVKLAERANKYVSYSDPLLDGTLPDGSRVNASLTEDVTTKGPTFSIRKFQEVPFSAIDLIDLGTASPDLMAYLWLALEYQNSGLVIGGTAAGKTTLLNAIVTFIPPEMKIVSIEDTRELQLPHENWIPSVTRSSAGGEQEDITMYKLLRESFRQNPDYVVVGEVRGKEASVLFQGMASGHPSLSTMHASTPADVISRLTTPPINLSPALVETLDLIISMTHAREQGENARRVKTVYEIEDISEEGMARTNEYITWTSTDDSFSVKKDSTVLDSIQREFGVSQQEIDEELERRKKILDWLHDQGHTHFKKVAKIVSEYYKDPEAVMEMVEEEALTGFEDLVEKDEMPAEVERTWDELSGIEQEEAHGPEEEVDYDEMVRGTVQAVKRRVRTEDLELEKVLEAERGHRNRQRLVRWLEDLMERKQGLQEDREKSREEEESEDLFEEEEMEENPFE